jgi:hypothetical protein
MGRKEMGKKNGFIQVHTSKGRFSNRHVASGYRKKDGNLISRNQKFSLRFVF